MNKNSNRFEHLKNKKKDANLPTKEEFIAEPLKEYSDILERNDQNKEKNQNEEIDSSAILLAVSGRINRERDCGKGRLIYIRSDVERDIKKYCRGNKTLLINFLLRKGLDQLISDNKQLIYCEDDNL